MGRGFDGSVFEGNMKIHRGLKTVGAADPAMAEIIKRAGPFQPPPGRGDPFGYLAQAIMFQQLAGRAATGNPRTIRPGY
jgi:3-methyladenine DNA glycosylase/8-oxoguanine DNA glycosylase